MTLTLMLTGYLPETFIIRYDDRRGISQTTTAHRNGKPTTLSLTLPRYGNANNNGKVDLYVSIDGSEETRICQITRQKTTTGANDAYLSEISSIVHSEGETVSDASTALEQATSMCKNYGGRLPTRSEALAILKGLRYSGLGGYPALGTVLYADADNRYGLGEYHHRPQGTPDWSYGEYIGGTVYVVCVL